MAPLLSAMETGEAMSLHTEDDFLDGVPASLPYPSNLALIGTVNMDETTHGLSDKVLDRAFVLEFWDVDLEMYPRWGTRQLASNHEKVARDVLGALMKALAPARLHFGWRVVDDVLDFLAGVATAGTHLPFEVALDSVIYAKVLPKIRCEDAPRFRDALQACEGALSQFKLLRCAAKVGELRRDLETTGSARFWR
jgi:5-methylcytosine-specific restriction enzyme B